MPFQFFNMKILRLGIFICLLQIDVTHAQCSDVESDSSPIDSHAIPSECSASYEITVELTGPSDYYTATVNRPSTFADDYGFCDIYEGSDSSGTFVGRAEGAHPVGTYFVTSTPVHFACEGYSSNYDVIVGEANNFEESEFSVSDNPVSVATPNFPSAFGLRDSRKWRFTTEESCDFILDFTPFILPFLGFADITSDEGVNARLEKLNEDNVIYTEARGSYVQVTFWGITPADGFRLTVSCANDQSIICSEEPIISLDDEELQELGVSGIDEIVISPQRLYDTSTLPSECIATVDDPVFHINLTDCQPIIQVDDDYIYVTYVIRNQPHKNSSYPIQRYDDNCFNRTCKFDKSQLLNSSVIYPEIRKTIFDPIQEEGRFDVGLQFYTNASCVKKLEETTVTVPNYIYVKSELEEIDPSENNFILQATDCWATPTSDPNDAEQYVIITDGCPEDNDFDPDNAIVITRNYEPIYAAFQFQSFVWTGIVDEEQIIYVHCDVTVCQDEVETCTGPNCSGKRRRSVAEDKNSKIVSHGPIYVVSNRDTCEHGNGGCSDLCFMIGLDVGCACHEGRTLSEDGKTCESIASISVGEVKEDYKNMMIVIAISAIASLIAVGICFVRSRKSAGETFKF